jgi:hypothetical protein
MKLRVRWEVSEQSGAKTTLRRPMSLLDRLIAYNLLLVVVLIFPFFLASLFALASGSSSPDIATGRTFEIALGWRTTTYYFVVPWLGLIYDSVKIALEITGGAFLLLAGLSWLFKRIKR